MRHHLHDDSLQSQLRPGEGAEQDESHVADAAIGHQSLDIRLRTGQHCGIENPDHP